MPRLACQRLHQPVTFKVRCMHFVAHRPIEQVSTQHYFETIQDWSETILECLRICSEPPLPLLAWVADLRPLNDIALLVLSRCLCVSLLLKYAIDTAKHNCSLSRACAFKNTLTRLQITDYRLAPSKWGAREEPTSAPWATIEDTLSS
jgi:hypothetical protein